METEDQSTPYKGALESPSKEFDNETRWPGEKIRDPNKPKRPKDKEDKKKKLKEKRPTFGVYKKWRE